MNSKYNKEEGEDNDNLFILTDAIVDAYATSLQFYSRLNRSFIEALFVPFTDAWEELREIRKEVKREDKVYFTNYNDYLKYQQEYYNRYEKIIMSRIRNKFDTNFREEGFTRSLSDFIDSYSELAKLIGFGQLYQYASNFTSL